MHNLLELDEILDNYFKRYIYILESSFTLNYLMDENEIKLLIKKSTKMLNKPFSIQKVLELGKIQSVLIINKEINEEEEKLSLKNDLTFNNLEEHNDNTNDNEKIYGISDNNKVLFELIKKGKIKKKWKYYQNEFLVTTDINGKILKNNNSLMDHKIDNIKEISRIEFLTYLEKLF